MSISKGNFHQLQHLIKCFWQIGNGGVYHLASEPAQSALCKDRGGGIYEKPSEQSFVVYLTAEMLSRLIFVGLDLSNIFLQNSRSFHSFSVPNTTSPFKLL
jgi:hypothetical protein